MFAAQSFSAFRARKSRLREGLCSSQDNPSIQVRLARLERNIDALQAHFRLSEKGLVEPDLQEVRSLVAAGRKIEAIKLYREQTGAGLAEAKDAVDRL